MFESIFAKGSLSAGNVLLALGAALILGIASAAYYAFRNRFATRSFLLTAALLPLITATVIMAVNGNLGAGIAVAGSFSMIRFRSAQGSGQEILAVFLSASLGLCLGAGYVAVACLLLVLYIAALQLLGLLRFGERAERQRELRISLPEALDYEGLFDDLLDGHFAAYELERVHTIEMGTAYQLVYRVIPRDACGDREFLDAVRERNGNLPVSLGRVPETRQTI